MWLLTKNFLKTAKNLLLKETKGKRFFTFTANMIFFLKRQEKTLKRSANIEISQKALRAFFIVMKKVLGRKNFQMRPSY